MTGRWGFITGVEHATWVGLNCLEVDDAGGPPGMRLAVVRREDVVIEDTWQVSGLRGTGSQHVRAEGIEVPATWTCNPMAGEPCVDLRSWARPRRRWWPCRSPGSRWASPPARWTTSRAGR